MADNQQSNPGIWTPANIVTGIRIFLVPVFMVVLLIPWTSLFPNWQDASLWQPWVAAGLFALVSCTDFVDGYLARSRGEVTDFGKFVDPLADKILVCGALLFLCELGFLPAWAAWIIVCREFIVSGLRMLAATKGMVIAASWYGKFKTATTMVAIVMFIVMDSPTIHAMGEGFANGFLISSWVMMGIALILTIWSMIDYFMKCSSIFKPSDGDAVELNEHELAAQVIATATTANAKLSTAESCTGGLIAGALTAIPGSSAVVEGGIVSYSNDVKMRELKVSREDLSTYGAVSSEVALQMACGSRKALHSDIAVSVTGIAGPSGGTDRKPIGTVWFGVASAKGARSEVRHFDGDRDEVRQLTVYHALELFLEELAR